MMRRQARRAAPRPSPSLPSPVAFRATPSRARRRQHLWLSLLVLAGSILYLERACGDESPPMAGEVMGPPAPPVEAERAVASPSAEEDAAGHARAPLPAAEDPLAAALPLPEAPPQPFASIAQVEAPPVLLEPKPHRFRESKASPADVPRASEALGASGASHPRGLGWVQIASFKTEAGATRAWERLRGEQADLLSALGHRIERAVLDGGRVTFRVQVGPLGDRDAVARLCEAMKERGLGCWPVR
jgi:hypothetical protein